jgi:hypothetical protein
VADTPIIVVAMTGISGNELSFRERRISKNHLGRRERL